MPQDPRSKTNSDLCAADEEGEGGRGAYAIEARQRRRLVELGADVVLQEAHARSFLGCLHEGSMGVAEMGWGMEERERSEVVEGDLRKWVPGRMRVADLLKTRLKLKYRCHQNTKVGTDWVGMEVCRNRNRVKATLEATEQWV